MHQLDGNVDEILIKYEYIIKIVLSKYNIDRSDYDDAFQEGRIGLYKAINAFKKNKGASFITFASLCINRQILSFLRSQGRNKNKINKYTSSLDYSEEEIFKLSNRQNNIENYIFTKMYYESVYRNAFLLMNKLEKLIYFHYLFGYTINELSEEYNISKKKIYFIIAKAKKKIEQKLNDY